MIFWYNAIYARMNPYRDFEKVPKSEILCRCVVAGNAKMS